MTKSEAFNIFGWMMFSIVFSKILGALLGDLLIGNKRAIVIGALTQAIGAFMLTFSSISGLYIGMTFLVIGGGLYSPNLISQFGKLYLSKTKLLDSAFTILYFATNIGAFLGVLLIGYLGEKFGLHYGFIVAGILLIIAALFPLLVKESSISEDKTTHQVVGFKKFGRILYALMFVGIFWAMYEIATFPTFQIRFSLSDNWTIPMSIWPLLSSVSLLVFSLIFIISWSRFYSNQFIKLLIGCICGTVSLSLLMFIHEFPTNEHLFLYIISLILLGVSEVHIAPIIHSILTKYTSSKYLAITLSLAFIPTAAIGYAVRFFTEGFYESPSKAISVGIIGMALISIGIITYLLINKKTTYNHT